MLMTGVLLQTTAASEAVERFTTLALGARDALVGAGVFLAILITGWLIAFATAWIVKQVLRFARFNEGLRGLLGHPVLGAHEPAAIAAWAIYWLLLSIALVIAVDSLGLDLGSSLAARLRDILPRVLTATILLAR